MKIILKDQNDDFTLQREGIERNLYDELAELGWKVAPVYYTEVECNANSENDYDFIRNIIANLISNRID